jgi:hypothetical protein
MKVPRAKPGIRGLNNLLKVRNRKCMKEVKSDGRMLHFETDNFRVKNKISRM